MKVTLTDTEREEINLAIKGGRGYYESSIRTQTAVAAIVRQRMADAWDEGKEAGRRDHGDESLLHNGIEVGSEFPRPNPYRGGKP